MLKQANTDIDFDKAQLDAMSEVITQESTSVEDEQAAKQKKLEQKTVIWADYTPIADDSFLVECKISENDQIRNVIVEIIKNNAESVQDYKNGHDRAIKFLMGQVMKETKGKANPKMAMDILTEELQ